MAETVNKSFLVTGGAGYIGSHMVKMLNQAGYKVTVIDDFSRGSVVSPGTDFYKVSLLDSEAIKAVLKSKQPDVVMHFAAFAYVGESVAEPLSYYENNLVGTINLLCAMQSASINKLVYSSSCTVYGIPKSLPITESMPLSPISPYGQTKKMAETIIRDTAATSMLSAVSLRYFNAAGCDIDGELGELHEPEPHLIPTILKEALRLKNDGNPQETTLVVNGDDYDTPDGACIRDYVHVQDICRAHQLAADRLGKPGVFEVYNLALGRGYSVLEVIEACRQITQQDIQFKIGSRREGDPAALVASAEAANAVLGWRPEITELTDIIASAWHWFERNSKP